uniref:response regulator transcription factor n=1 Tax=Lysinibacillus sp. D4A3_S15 TaxID=2941227 RepID=UPI0020C0BDB4
HSHIASTGHEAILYLQESAPDFVILDLSLPDCDGIEICRKIREHSNVATLILSASGSDTDKVLGLGFAADDYMTKTFSLSELVARIDAHLRRQVRWLQDHDVQKDVIHIDNIVINKQEYLFLRDIKPIPL